MVTVVEVSGLIDPVVADFVESQVTEANASGVVAIVLQLNSEGTVVSDSRLDELVATIEASAVPVVVWVGPSGSQARGGATRLITAADVSGLAPGSRVEVTPELAAGADLAGLTAVGEFANAETAVDAGLVDNDAPVIGDFIVNLDGVRTEVNDDGPQPRRQPVTQVRFTQLSLVSQLMHTVASPAVAYLLFIIGLGLLVFELFTAGIGIAGVVGAGSLVLGSYGLAVLPTRTWAIGLLLLAMFGFAVDVQVGAPRFWTAVGTVSFVIGSIALYDGVTVSWITLVVGILGMVVAMISGMPAMVRTRFSTPTIGREWMIGETGEAVAAVDPEGVVRIREAPWRARTNRATPIAPGERVRVTSIEGLILEVEPEAGGARDHRERRNTKL
ncbi:MAG TPA: NfeD family protein [Acidimicrobiales bacterium]|nr:NfeD family protein [Acidimicrobiales bacterium]